MQAVEMELGKMVLKGESYTKSLKPIAFFQVSLKYYNYTNSILNLSEFCQLSQSD